MSDPTRLSRRYSTMVVATISLIVLTCAAYLIPMPYVTMRPGPAFDTLYGFFLPGNGMTLEALRDSFVAD